jgi:hypothetical protein
MMFRRDQFCRPSSRYPAERLESPGQVTVVVARVNLNNTTGRHNPAQETELEAEELP